MRNLLSEQTKRELKIEYRLRIAVVGTVLLSVVCLIGIISLFPPYVLSKTHKVAIESEEALLEGRTSNSNGDAGKIVSTTKIELQLLSDLDKNILFSKRLEGVILSKPDGISVRHIMYVAQKGEDAGSFTMGGLADTRDTLLSFKQELERQPNFDTVLFPVSNLAKDRDIKFSITAEGPF